MRSLRKTNLKNWSSILNIRFELIIDFTKNNERSEETLPRCNRRPGDRVDNILRKSTPDNLDRYRTPYMGLILDLWI